MVASWEGTVQASHAALEKKLAESGFAGQVAHVGADTLNVAAVPLDKVLSAKELEITELGVGQLLAKLSKGELKSEEVTRAFCHRAVIAHELTNCLTDIFFDKAIARARALDAQFAESGKPSGALHGLPISLKNQINVAGEEMNLCYVGWTGRVSRADSALVKCLVQQGAVLYCYTNMPQALFSGETVCNLYGRTVNPHNRALAAGGSSGGEGALVAMHGSPLGVGSDIGGSIRIPCAFNGLYGLRPSYDRIPYGGSSNSMEGFTVVPSVLGPMSTSLDGVKAFFRAVVDAEPWRYDPLALHMPWSEAGYALREHGDGKSLCFGVVHHNGMAKPDVPYVRALEMLKKALVAQGHTVIDYVPPEAAKGADLLTRLFLADGGEDVRRECALSGEPVLGGIFKGKQLPPAISTYEFWQLCAARREYIAMQLASWEATRAETGTGRPVDALLCPPAVYPSFRHGDQQDIFYTGLCNLCDWPTGVFPVTRVDPAIDQVAAAPEFERTEFLSEFDRINYERYDPEVYKDIPVAMQLIGRKGEDEAVIRMMEIAVEALREAAAE
ncbi:hypothetical protein JCM3774_000339 [Rhodotorula dairenensis]